MKESIITRNLPSQFHKTWLLAWPVIIANLSLPLLNLADAAILGHLDDSVYLAGVTVGGALMAYIFWGFNFLAMGLSGFTSQALGRKNPNDVLVQLFHYVLVASTLILIVLVGQKLFIHFGLKFISPPVGAMREANLYLSIRMWGVPAIVFNSMLLGFFIGLQNTRIGLYTLAVTQLVNIGLNVLFVYGLGLTTAGIAIGTVISEYLGLALILYHLIRAIRSLKTQSNLVTRFANLTSLSLAKFRSIFHVSSHLFIRSFLLLSAFAWFNRISAQFGEVSLAANGVLLAFFTLIANFLDGTAAAAEAQTGHAYGQNNPATLRQVWIASGAISILFMVVLSLAFAIAGNAFISVLTSQTDVAQLASDTLFWVVCLPLTGGIAFWLDGVFIGARRSKDMRNSVIAAFTLFVIASSLFADNHQSLWLWFNLFFVTRSVWLLTVFYKKMLHSSGS